MEGRKMLINEKIGDYLEVLKSEAPAPGGGAVCALSGAQGAALVMMVANLTIGKKKYADDEALCISVRDEADGLLSELEAGIDADKVAFGKVSAAYSMPKETESEKEARRDAIAIASVGAADAPLAVMRAALRALQLTDSLIGHSNRNLVSDLYVAALNLQTCIVGAELNVAANIPSIRDKADAESKKAESDRIVEEGMILEDKILADAK